MQISPEDFRKSSLDAIEDNINAKYANRVSWRGSRCNNCIDSNIRSFRRLVSAYVFMISWRLQRASLDMALEQSMWMVSRHITHRAIAADYWTQLNSVSSCSDLLNTKSCLERLVAQVLRESDVCPWNPNAILSVPLICSQSGPISSTRYLFLVRCFQRHASCKFHSPPYLQVSWQYIVTTRNRFGSGTMMMEICFSITMKQYAFA